MRTVLVSLVLLSNYACSDSPTSPSPRTLTIHGSVITYATGAARAGATVWSAHETDGIEVTATSNANGAYELTLPRVGGYRVVVDGFTVGNAVVTGSDYRGELLFGDAQCASRFGTLSDARTMKPVQGAAVSLAGQTVRSGPDGWFRIDLGCRGPMPGNTTIMYVTHPDYEDRQQVAGRGVNGVVRVDLELDPD